MADETESPVEIHDTEEEVLQESPKDAVEETKEASTPAEETEDGHGLGISVDGTDDAASKPEVADDGPPKPTEKSIKNRMKIFEGGPKGAEPSKETSSQKSSMEKPPVPPKEAPEAAESNAVSTTDPSNLTLENVPTLAHQPPSGPSSRDRSISPSKGASRGESPSVPVPGLSGDLPYPSGPPPSSADRLQALEQRQIGDRSSPPPPQANLARKASSGLGSLFGRMGNMRKTNPARSPPAPKHEAGASTASVLSGDGNPINGHQGSQDGSPKGRRSLQDQFSSLRRQEEYSTGTNGIHEESDDTGAGDDAVTSQPTSPIGQNGDVRHARSHSSASVPKPGTLNPSLPPGTASGMSAGPAEDDKEVDWDLWQQVVYEGPAAVARTSGDELNQAIASGIPAAIRGVVWQVLAESKNEDLEDIYRTLKARGSEGEQRPPPASRSISTVSLGGASADKEATASSDASSEHSETSTTANSTVTSPQISPEGAVSEAQAKASAEKQKREAAALQKLEKAIKRDLGSRTSFSKYTQSAGLQDGLFGVCKAYALFDEGVGYAQGINFIAMPLLFNMTEEESFTLLVRLMSKYDLRSMFTADMPGLHLHLYHFERLLEDLEPAVYCHLKRRHVGPQLYATQWFLTLFAYRFPLQLVLRIYDLIFCEGLTAILKFGIVLMQRNRQALLDMKDMSQLTSFLKEKLFDVYIDKSPTASSLLDSGFFGSVTGGADKELYRAEEMVRDACAVDISEATLARYTAEWEESQRSERERETEIETLRSANAAFAIKVKALEERVQQHDSEHVNFAQDLVKIKVENDTLQDTNEGLKLQVEELQKLLDAQPAEVEERLKQEMDRIMQRNIEVQNENRSLKEDMDEMEHELVNAKMSRAQTQADHDSLKQKWSSVQALLNEEK